MSLPLLKNPEVWQKVGSTEDPRWICLVCGDGRMRAAKHCAEHETSKKHEESLEHMKSSNFEDAEDFDEEMTSFPYMLDAESPTEDFYNDDDNVNGLLVSPSSPVLQNIESGSFNTTLAERLSYNIDPTFEESVILRMLNNLTSYSIQGPELNSSVYSDSDAGDERSDATSDTNSLHEDSSSGSAGLFQVVDPGEQWYPWPNKSACIMDILCHLPRSTISDKQSSMITWTLCSLGVTTVPGESSMKVMIKKLQGVCGIRTKQYKGALGHIYYVNDFLGMIGQEMANPYVRSHLHFYPEITQEISAAYQSQKWLSELDLDLLTPMVRRLNQDFFVLEPAILSTGIYCVPFRYFQKDGEIFSYAWHIHPWSIIVNGFSESVWIVDQRNPMIVSETQLNVSFPYFCTSYRQRGVPDPKSLYYVILEDGTESQWRYTNPNTGNRWRTLAKGHRVFAFPVWLYCDDTSGNSSKKWNKHNSYLFTAAGLEHEQAHLEYNAHFLCTSNLAPPLEMLDGIVDQLEVGQKCGIWAYDCVLQENVLVIPSVLALLGDNPMQSEMACHVGLNGNLPCRICLVSSAPAKKKKGKESVNISGQSNTTATGSNQQSNEHNGAAIHEDSASDGDNAQSDASAASSAGGAAKKPKKKIMTMQDYADFAGRMMIIGKMRNKLETARQLREIFDSYTSIGRKEKAKTMKTTNGIKDTYQEVFLARVDTFRLSLSGSNEAKQAEIDVFIRNLPANIYNPVWRIRSLDAHLDTPVEILHVVLLGFAKYFWRDAIERISDAQKEILATRLSSVNIQGLSLRLPNLAGKTLVKHAKSLVGRDFRAIVQIAPFVLYDMLPDECFESWLALSTLIPLIFQPVIKDIDTHLKSLKEGLNHLLNCVANWSPRWFNKTKFHILLHLADHVYSIHSNRQAPSRDIGKAFANVNRIRHLLSGGKFFTSPNTSKSDETVTFPDHGDLSLLDNVKDVGAEVKNLLDNDPYLRRFYIPQHLLPSTNRLEYDKKLRRILWDKTKSSKVLPAEYSNAPSFSKFQYNSCKSFTLTNNDLCKLSEWVILRHGDSKLIGRVEEILQIPGSSAELASTPNFLLILNFTRRSISEVYGMPVLTNTGSYAIIDYKNILCTVNIQHNCKENDCHIAGTHEIYQERVKTSMLGASLIHQNIDDVVLNTCQMRNYKYIRPFCPQINPMDRQAAIYAGAAREIATQRARAEKSNPSSGSMLENVLDPLQALRGRGRGRGSGESVPGPSTPGRGRGTV